MLFIDDFWRRARALRFFPLPHYEVNTTHPRWEQVKAGYDFNTKGRQKHPMKSKQLCHDPEHYRVNHKSRKLSRACSNNREFGGGN